MEKTCFECGKGGAGADKRCGACHTAVYCCAKCQRTAWKKHKLQCMPPTINNKNDGAAATYDHGDCPICFDSLVSCEMRFMPCCGEELCMGCSNKWTDQCAFCRTPETRDPLEIAKRCRKLAESGRAIGQLHFGTCYSEGEGVVQNHAEAARWFRLAADQGLADAQCSLGQCYSEGKGVVQDHAEAARRYRLAADQGHATAQCLLGQCYAYGKGVAQDCAEAARRYRLAADQGYSISQFKLGACYYKGLGVVLDHVEAVRWYRLAGDQGHAEAQCSLGVLYFHGNGVECDVEQAAQWFKRAAQQGHEQAKKYFRAALEVIKSTRVMKP